MLWRIEAIQRERNGKIVGYRAVAGEILLQVEQESTFFNRKGRSLEDCKRLALEAVAAKNAAEKPQRKGRRLLVLPIAEAEAAPQRKGRRPLPTKPLALAPAPSEIPAADQPARKGRRPLPLPKTEVITQVKVMRAAPSVPQIWRAEEYMDWSSQRPAGWHVIRGEGAAMRYLASYNYARFKAHDCMRFAQEAAKAANLEAATRKALHASYPIASWKKPLD
jgi:hypothetical protein